MPLFPLGTVLLPGASLPLHIFEPRYRQMTIDLVTGAVPGKQFGVVAVRDGWNPDDGRAGLHDVGCTASLREVRRLPDGRFDILTLGDRRFRLVDVDDTSAPYLVGSVEWLPDADGEQEDEGDDIAPLELAARAAHRRYCTTAWRQRGGSTGPGAGDAVDGTEDDAGDTGESGAEEGVAVGADAEQADPAVLAHLLVADCLLPLADRQALLEQTCPKARLKLARSLMVREAGLLSQLRAVWAPASRFAVEHSDN